MAEDDDSPTSPLSLSIPSSASPARPAPSRPVDYVKDGPRLGAGAAFQDMVLGAALKGVSASMVSTKDAKAPLRIQTTTVAFRRFVQKGGPVFRVQDQVESVLRWEDTPKTLFAGAMYAALCYNPLLLLCLPQAALVAAFVSTHNRHSRPPLNAGNEALLDARTPSPELAQAATQMEGQIDYVANLQDIQNMMSRVSDLTDLGRSLLPLFDWSHPRRTLILMQALVLTIPLTLLILPYLPLRPIALIGGEAVLAVAHPHTQALLKRAKAKAPTRTPFHERFLAVIAAIIATDALPDTALDIPTNKMKLAHLVEHERRVDAPSVAQVDEAPSMAALQTMDPSLWVPEDRGHAWTDAEGGAAEPASHLPPPEGCQWLEGDVWIAGPWRIAKTGMTRARRWTRRAVYEG